MQVDGGSESSNEDAISGMGIEPLGSSCHI